MQQGRVGGVSRTGGTVAGPAVGEPDPYADLPVDARAPRSPLIDAMARSSALPVVTFRGGGDDLRDPAFWRAEPAGPKVSRKLLVAPPGSIQVRELTRHPSRAAPVPRRRRAGPSWAQLMVVGDLLVLLASALLCAR